MSVEYDDNSEGSGSNNIINPALIIDNGSGRVKAGFSGEAEPCVVFPAIIGVPKYKKSMKHGKDSKNIYVGMDAHDKRGILKLTYPIEHGIVTDWKNMEHIWSHTFDQLRVDASDRNVLLTEAPRNPKKNREKMAEIMFETFNIAGLYIAIQGVLSLYASGRTTGTVLDIGDGVTHTVPIYDGYSIENAINRFDLAGRDVTEYMQKLLEEEGINLNTSSEKEIVRHIKEKFSYCTIDINKEEELYQKRNMTRKYTLPDGNPITLGDVMYQTPEVLFRPELIGKEIMGVHEAVNDSIMKSDIDIRKDMYSNIVLSGGTTMIKNFDIKLKHELENVVPDKATIKIISPKERNYSVWIGGSILSAIPSFESAWIYNNEYSEAGKSIVHARCM